MNRHHLPRAVLLALVVAFAWTAGVAHGQPAYDDYLDAANFDEWSIVPEVGDAVPAAPMEWKDASVQLAGLRSRLVTDAALPATAREEFAWRLDSVLNNYDGTQQKAEYLSRKEFAPRECVAGTLTEPGEDCAWKIFSGVVIPREPDGTWTAQSLSRFASYVLIAYDLIASVEGRHLNEAAASLQEAAARWDRYVQDGYSQYPWELFVNGATTNENDWSPTATKFIVLHPSVGVVVGRPNADVPSTLSPIFVVEAFGAVHYADDFSGYRGLSIGATMLDMQPDQFGAALTLHWTSLHAGASYGLSDDIEGDWSIYVTVDAASGSDNAALREKIPGFLRGFLK